MKLSAILIDMFGKMYFFKTPFFFIYDPHVHKVKGQEARYISNVLEPGDILLSKFDGYISSRMIKGFWSHAAIYVGNNTIIHAIGKGVQIEDILDFVRTDHIVVLRLKNVSQDEINTAIEKAFKMAEDKIMYDYDFDSDNEALYCTELVNACYNYRFKDYFETVAGNFILNPRGIYNSGLVDNILEFRH